MSQNGLFSFHGSRCLPEGVVGAHVATEQSEVWEYAGRPLEAVELALPGELHAGDVELATEAAQWQAHHQWRPGEGSGRQARISRLEVPNGGIRTIGALSQ